MFRQFIHGDYKQNISLSLYFVIAKVLLDYVLTL